MTVPFSNDKFPPAPVLTVQLSIPQEAPHPEHLTALIDTGSDFTLVPLSWLILIDAPESRSARIRGLWSPLQEVTVYYVDIHLEQGILPGVEVVGVPGDENAFESEEMVLGRNVLNLLYLLLEGPNQQTTVLERRPRRL